MPLKLIYGPPNSGRAGLIRKSFTAVLEHDPVLVVPNLDDVFSFEREICGEGVAIGGSTMTFGALFAAIATAGGSPPGTVLTPAQRRRAIALAIAECHEALGPLRGSASRPGFAFAFERLLDELQAAGLDPEAVEAESRSSAYLHDIATLFAGYIDIRERLGRIDSHGVAREAIALLRDSAEFWNQRPVFLYSLDDLTRNQFELIGALAQTSEVTMALPYEDRAAMSARAALLERLRTEIGVAEEERTEADPANTPNELLFHIERGFGTVDAKPLPPTDGLTFLRSAGERGEAEAIATEVARLIASGADPSRIAIALRDPVRRGPLLASVLESYGVPVALEAELPVTETAVGSGMLALLEAEFGARRASDLLRHLRGPSGAPPGRVDWLERAVRRGRVQTAKDALRLWVGEDGELPFDLARLRAAAGGPAVESVQELAGLAATMASRALHGGDDGPRIPPDVETELRAAGAISEALSALCELDALAPSPDELAGVLRGIGFRVWSGPVGKRVRIASPYRLRAGRFAHVFVGSLQDGEFPRRGGGDPFLSEGQRDSLGLDPRRDAEAEERYLFYICLSLPEERLFLSYRDSDEAGAAKARSPLLDEVRKLLDPAPPSEGHDPVEESITRGRELAQVVQSIAEASSEDELARAVAARSRAAEPAELLTAAEASAQTKARLTARLDAAREAAKAAWEPGPLTNRSVIDSLASVPAYGGTTLEEFDLCSYRWFVGHELDPQPLDPKPDPLIQGGLMHEVLETLYRERPGDDLLPRPESLEAWLSRGRQLVAEGAEKRELGDHPVDRALKRRVERLLARFLTEESERFTGGFAPWLFEARFGAEDDGGHPALEIDGWGLHGSIDRIDRSLDRRALVIDYKLSGSVTAREKLEEQSKLQLQLYMLAVAEHWQVEPIGGLYHPLRGTSGRRPRGMVLDEAAEELKGYSPYKGDIVSREEMNSLLTEARERAGGIVARMRSGDIRRDPGPREGLRGHDACPAYCEFAPICRRDRAPLLAEDSKAEEQ
jgi:ATP-dependent helicase/DNAse subunit B